MKFQITDIEFDFGDDYEDFGYEVKNAKRYKTRSKRQAKFKDYDDAYASDY